MTDVDAPTMPLNCRFPEASTGAETFGLPVGETLGLLIGAALGAVRSGP